jgi:hypothetical protein
MKRRQTAIDERIDAFVRDITDLIRREVQNTLKATLGARARAAAPERGRRNSLPAEAPPAGKRTRRARPEVTPEPPPRDGSRLKSTDKKRRPEQLTLF